MKKLLISPCVILVLLALPIGWSAAATDPTSFVDDLGTRVLAIVNDRQLTANERETRLDRLAVEAFDVPRIARFVLGRHWAAASASEREQFIKVFEHYIVHIYGARFAQYHDAKFAVISEQTQARDQILVRSRIDRAAEPPINVNWLVAKKEDAYKIVDVNMEGVSLLLTYREEFSSVIQRNGGQVSALIERLREATRG
jgi:phospholipid transport system substrate-binding protein